MSNTILSNSRFPTRNFGKILSLSILICATFILPASAQEKAKLWRTLTVSGRGVETISTTLSQVSLGVEIQGKTAEDVQKEAARKSSAVVDLLKKRNVEKLTTTGIRLNPVYSYSNNVQRITGYAASNTVSFRISTDKAGTLLDDAVIDDLSIGSTTYALLMEWDNLYAPAALYQLLQKGVMVKVATQPFDITVGDTSRHFEYGTLLIPIQQSGWTRSALEELLNKLLASYHTPIHQLTTGFSTSGVDLGSSKFVTLAKPQVALLTGAGVNATDAGEVWH